MLANIGQGWKWMTVMLVIESIYKRCTLIRWKKLFFVKSCPIGKNIGQSGHPAFAPYSTNMDNLIFHYCELQLLMPYNIVN
jgi:hypothetical protein